jgi:superfamily II DNA or RNA helicase
MKINFEGLASKKTVDNVVAPREIFGLLPRKGGRFQYLRDVQAEVLNQWFSRKDEKDIVLKMNTGSGKTLMGLLILKSSLNDGAILSSTSNFPSKRYRDCYY